MAFRKFKKSRYQTKKSYKRYKRRKIRKQGNPNAMVMRKSSIMPDRLFVKLNYVDDLHTTSTSTTQGWLYAGNDVYDPYTATGGHQPLGHNQYSALYNKFYVRGSKISVKFVSADIGTSVFIAPSNQNILLPNITTILEQPDTKYTVVAPGVGRTMLKHYWTTKKAFGAKAIGPQDEAYVGFTGSTGTGGSPANLWYWNIGFRNVDPAVAGSIFAQVKITYYVEYISRKQLAESN